MFPWRPSSIRRLALAVTLWLGPSLAVAETVTVAVAANFVTTLEKLATRFEADSGHEVRIVSGSTGKIYTQIIHGAPFDLFLAADAARPARLVEEGRARRQDRRPYALGRLVLWSRGADASEALLQERALTRVAIANPDLAPYGVAAMETLDHYGLTGEAAPALVSGENVAQAIAMLATGNVDHAFVPLSIRGNAALSDIGTMWVIPPAAYAPIRQDAVLLKRGAENPAAVAFFTFLASEKGGAIILADGYALAGGAP